MTASGYDSSQYDISNELGQFSLEFSRLVTQISFVLRDKPELAEELMTDKPPYEELEHLLRREYKDVPFKESLPEVLRFTFRVSMVDHD